MIKGRGIIKGRHLALYQILKTTVFTTKYIINCNTTGSSDHPIPGSHLCKEAQ